MNLILQHNVNDKVGRFHLKLSLICISWENQLKKFQFLQGAARK